MKKTSIMAILLLSAACGRQDPKVLHESSGGNGGDALPFVFQYGRYLGAEKLLGLQDCMLREFPESTLSDVEAWTIENIRSLADDVLNSPHEWIENSVRGFEFNCAWTEGQRNGKIILSFEQCKNPQVNDRLAAMVLIHESVHHLGIQDETFANEVANTVVIKATPVGRCGNPSSIDPITTPYVPYMSGDPYSVSMPYFSGWPYSPYSSPSPYSPYGPYGQNTSNNPYAPFSPSSYSPFTPYSKMLRVLPTFVHPQAHLQ